MKVGIIGGSGYTGAELTRILLGHPKIGPENIVITSREHKDKDVSELHTNLLGRYNKKFIGTETENLDVDFAFLCVPHGSGMEHAPKLLDRGIKVVDLSADYRIKNIKIYEEFYIEHKSPKLVEEAIYGLPEIWRKEIRKANLVANPGCYATSAILAIAPLAGLKKNLDLDKIVVDSKSGVSGAGARLDRFTQFNEISENLKPYSIVRHRHRPEIEEKLGLIFHKRVRISFTPMLAPIIRGMSTNAHVFCNGDDMDINEDMLKETYKRFYRSERFIRIVDALETKNVRDTNFCDIGVFFDEHTQRIVASSVIDNLVKGASGQAVQNMNIMMGFREDMGLKNIAGHP